LVNGNLIPYDDIDDVSVRGRRVTINTTVNITDNKLYRLSVGNAQEIRDAIAANKAAVTLVL